MSAPGTFVVESYGSRLEVVDEQTVVVTLARLRGPRAQADADLILACLDEFEGHNSSPAHTGFTVDALKKAAHEGWLACRREVFSLTEDTINKGISSEFEHGRCFEAKGIAKTLGAMSPEDSDELRSAIARVAGSAA